MNDIIASIKLIILKRYEDGQLNSSSTKQSFEAALDELIANKYGIYFIFKYFSNIYYYRFSGQPVAGNADGFVQTIINDMERLYTVKQQRSYSLNT